MDPGLSLRKGPGRCGEQEDERERGAPGTKLHVDFPSNLVTNEIMLLCTPMLVK
jgi:hypothetical protein